MSKINLKHTINVFTEIGGQLAVPNQELLQLIDSESRYNAWFTTENVLRAVTAMGRMLNRADLEKWLSGYQLNEIKNKKTGLVLAGNIPLVGFHDVLCVLISGNYALVKASSQDSRLIKYILGELTKIAAEYEHRYSFVERLEDFDAIIATGSNNSSRYFEYYFGKVPNIIRKNRNSIALLTGNETTNDLYRLGHDIFDYFGLGCRNVSKLLVPAGYNFNLFFESIEVYQPIINHYKYSNNYGYNRSIYLLNMDEHLDNGFLLLKKDSRTASPLAVLYYEEYTDMAHAGEILSEQRGQLQCIVASARLQTGDQVVDFGESQYPKLWDYADGADTMEFLSRLS